MFICLIVVHLLVILQNNKRWTVQVLKYTVVSIAELHTIRSKLFLNNFMRATQVVGSRTEGHKTSKTKAGYAIQQHVSYNHKQPQGHFLTFFVLRRFLATYMVPPSKPPKFRNTSTIGWAVLTKVTAYVQQRRVRLRWTR